MAIPAAGRKTRILNLTVDNVTMSEALGVIDLYIHDGLSHYVVTPNVDHLVNIENDIEFKNVYDNADLVLADGMPLVWFSKLIKNPLKEKVSGSDLFPQLCDLASKKGYRVFLLGAGPGVAQIAAQRLQARYEGLNIVGTYSPPLGFEQREDEISHIVDIIRQSEPDILCVGLGSPKQEKFIFRYKERLKVPVSLAIGASIDFEAGRIKRAPVWMQRVGLEWFFRFAKEPKRLFKRYFIHDFKILKIIYKTYFKF